MTTDPNFVKLSRQLRKNQTPWEKKLWMHLKGSKFYGYKFKRQTVIGSFIYDFSCFEKKLLIELDGSQHTNDEIKHKDQAKEDFARKLGYQILRFYNYDIANNLEGVLEKIELTINR